MPFNSFEYRLHVAERLASSKTLGPTPEERELTAAIRRNPKLRHLAAYHDNLHQLSDEQLADLNDGERDLLSRYRALL